MAHGRVKSLKPSKIYSPTKRRRVAKPKPEYTITKAMDEKRVRTKEVTWIEGSDEEWAETKKEVNWVEESGDEKFTDDGAREEEVEWKLHTWKMRRQYARFKTARSKGRKWEEAQKMKSLVRSFGVKRYKAARLKYGMGRADKEVQVEMKDDEEAGSSGGKSLAEDEVVEEVVPAQAVEVEMSDDEEIGTHVRGLAMEYFKGKRVLNEDSAVEEIESSASTYSEDRARDMTGYGEEPENDKIVDLEGELLMVEDMFSDYDAEEDPPNDIKTYLGSRKMEAQSPIYSHDYSKRVVGRPLATTPETVRETKASGIYHVNLKTTPTTSGRNRDHHSTKRVFTDVKKAHRRLHEVMNAKKDEPTVRIGYDPEVGKQSSSYGSCFSILHQENSPAIPINQHGTIRNQKSGGIALEGTKHGNQSAPLSTYHATYTMLDPGELRSAPRDSEGTYVFSYLLFRGPEGQPVKMHYCDSLARSETIARLFLDTKVLGLDLEWKPGGATRLVEHVSMIQIASESHIALFHLAMFPGNTLEDLIAPSLKTILRSSDIIKTGSQVKGDGNRLMKHLECKCQTRIDVKQFLKHIGEIEDKESGALDVLVRRFYDLPLQKVNSVRMSNWSITVNNKQKEYAATDAYASLKVFQAIEALRLSKSPTPPFPDYVVPEIPTHPKRKGSTCRTTQYPRCFTEEPCDRIQSPNMEDHEQYCHERDSGEEASESGRASSG